jgi:hypothetical protein
MKIGPLLIFMALIISVILVVGCGPAGNTTPALTASSNNPTSSTPISTILSTQPGSIVGSPFLPGEVMATLPVYPGATPTTDFNPGFGPPSFPLEQPIYLSRSPGYQSASAQYTTPATAEDILNWYSAELGALGYNHEGQEEGGNGTITTRSIAFFLPSQPAVSVQVHVYTPGSAKTPVFELLVTYTVPLPKPSAESLPGDVESVKIDYMPGTANEVIKTFKDTQSIQSLVNLVNSLPVAPDTLRTGQIGVSPQTLFSLTFHSIAQGNIKITDVTYDGVHFGDYPLLDDPHNLFQKAVEQMLGIQAN